MIMIEGGKAADAATGCRHADLRRDTSRSRSVRNAARECTRTYMTERNRRRGNEMRSIYA